MSKVKTYVAVVAVAEVGTDVWTVASWHDSLAHAEGNAANLYFPEQHNVKVIETAITKVVGKTSDPELSAVKAQLAADAKAAKTTGVVASDVAAVAAPADDDVVATADVVGGMFGGGQTVEEATAFLDTMKDVFDAALADAKADLAARMSVAQKQDMGSRVHELALGITADELPAGVDPAEAADVVQKWVARHIPCRPADAAPARARMSVAQKRALGALVHAKAMLAVADLPGDVNADEATDVLVKWLRYIPS
jgi:hypothetical protein